MSKAIAHLQRTGGFVGVHEHVVVDDDGSAVVVTARPLTGRRSELQPDAVVKLQAALAAIDWDKLGQRPAGRPSPDGYIYELSNGTATVRATDGQIPDEVRAAIRLITPLFQASD